MADVAGAFALAARWQSSGIAAPAGRDLLALRAWVLARPGGPDLRDLIRLHAWIAAFQPQTSGGDGGGGTGGGSGDL